MRNMIAVCLLLLSLYSSAQNNDRPVRDSFILQLAVSKETVYESHIPTSPFVVGPKVLQLYPGETAFIEVEQKDGIVTDIKSVKENKNPEKTLEISFVQNVEKNVHSNMMLKVKNPFKQNLMYSATILLMKSNRWTETSIMPVQAGIMGIEMWPDIITSIGLSDWKFL